jgi:hypothetical protein
VHPTQPAPRNGVSTREIPVVDPTGPLPTAQPSAAAAAAAQPQPTGPVDYVPGPPPAGATAAPPPPPLVATPPSPDFLAGLLDDEPRSPRDRQARARLAGGVLAVAAVVLLELGLLVHVAGDRLWSRVPLWAGFATVAAVLGLAVLAAGLPGVRPLVRHAWTIAAGGLAGLSVFWLLVVLPSADSDRGFLLTAALACLGTAVWLTAGRAIPPERVLDRSGTVGTTASSRPTDS